jgi:hypothetical protein
MDIGGIFYPSPAVLPGAKCPEKEMGSDVFTSWIWNEINRF